MRPHQIPIPAAQRGFTLVESLVAMVVVSVGMLGVAALYVEGLRAGRTSIFRSTAIHLAGDMADRIRANPTAGNAYAGAGDGAGACTNPAANCNPGAMAASDIFWWQQVIAAQLPRGAGTVAVVPAAGALRLYTVTLSWSEPGLAAPVQYAIAVQM